MADSLRPEVELLLQVLRSDVLTRERTEQEWKAALELSAHHRVQPLFVSRLLQMECEIPEAILSECSMLSQAAARAGFWWNSELKGILAALNKNGIRSVPLKGPVLAATLFGETGLRSSRDLDVLVSKRDFPGACAVLKQIGFRVSKRADDYHQPWTRGTTTVELHFEVENPLRFDFDLGSAWSRLKPSTFMSVPIYKLATSDELVYLCLHAVRHRFESLHDVLDIALFVQTFGVALPTGIPPEMNVVAELGVSIATRLLPAIAGQVPVSYRKNPHVETLADDIWSRLLSGEAIEDGWFAKQRFYLRLEATRSRRAWRRFRHARILMTRTIDADFRFAARFGVHHSLLVWLLRPVRLALQNKNPS